MNGLHPNTNPWDDEADGVFFALTATLFAPSYTYGAGVLLASYDPEDEVAAPWPQVSADDGQPAIAITTEVVVSWQRRSTS
jgi:hypothetical protein